MAQIWMDDENAGAVFLPRSARKPMGDSLLPQSGKKKVLTKLDNVIYNSNNKPSITPFKGDNFLYNKNNKPNITPFKGANQKWPQACVLPKISLCKETLQKQHRKQQSTKSTRHLIQGQKRSSYLQATNKVNQASVDRYNQFAAFDFMDYPTEKCLKNCHQQISENWLELSDDFVEQLLNNSVEADEEIVNEIPLYQHMEDTVDSLLKSPEFEEMDLEDNLSDDMPPLPVSYDSDSDTDSF